jgi:hypothetical protein
VASIEAVIPEAQSMKAGGGLGDIQPSVTNAQAPTTYSFQELQSSSTLLNTVDMNAEVTSQLIGGKQKLPKVVKGGAAAAEIQANLGAFVSDLEGGVASGTGTNEKRPVRQRKKP